MESYNFKYPPFRKVILNGEKDFFLLYFFVTFFIVLVHVAVILFVVAFVVVVFCCCLCCHCLCFCCFHRICCCRSCHCFCYCLILTRWSPSRRLTLIGDINDSQQVLPNLSKYGSGHVFSSLDVIRVAKSDLNSTEAYFATKN